VDTVKKAIKTEETSGQILGRKYKGSICNTFMKRRKGESYKEEREIRDQSSIKSGVNRRRLKKKKTKRLK